MFWQEVKQVQQQIRQLVENEQRFCPEVVEALSARIDQPSLGAKPAPTRQIMKLLE